MSNRQQYEQTIAGKLDALPLPDMADAIWARIEARLDAELPPDNGPGGHSPNFPAGGFFIGGLSIILLTVLYLLFKPAPNNQQPQIDIPASNTTTVQPAAPLPQSSPPGNSSIVTAPAGNNAAGAPALPPIQQDSNLISNIPPALLPDTATQTAILPQVAAVSPPKKDTLPPAKKGRGVSGITDDDYRIVPKKDSSN